MIEFLLSFSCMLTVIQNEAKGENFYGKVAVGEVLRNRSTFSGKTICEEAKSPRQFAYAPALSNTNAPDSDTINATWEVLYHRSRLLPASTIYFVNPGKVDWPLSFLKGTIFVGSIQHHAFYSRTGKEESF